MTWLVEEPLPIIFIGIILEGVLFAILVQTAWKGWLYVMIGTLILFAGLVGLEYLVVTDVEKVESVLHETSADLEQNDLLAVLKHISPKATEMRADAENGLPRITITKAAIKSNLAVTVHPSGKRAVAKFNAVIVGSDNLGALQDFTYPRFFTIRFTNDGGQWLMTSYEHSNPIQGEREHAPRGIQGLPDAADF